MGHKAETSATSKRHIHRRPEYLRGVRDGVPCAIEPDGNGHHLRGVASYPSDPPSSGHAGGTSISVLLDLIRGRALRVARPEPKPHRAISRCTRAP